MESIEGHHNHQQLPITYRALQPQAGLQSAQGIQQSIQQGIQQGIQHGQPHLAHAHHTLASQNGLDLITGNVNVYQDLHLQDPSQHAFQTPNHFERNNGHRPLHVQNNDSPHTPQEHGNGGQFGILTANPLQHNAIGRLQDEADMYGTPGDGDQKSVGHLSTKLVVDPPNLREWRQKLFDVGDTIILSEDEFQTYFPHVDNVYSHRSTQKYKKKPFVSHYWDCRLKGRPPGTPKSTDPNKKKRKRVARERDLCDVKIKITEYFPGALLRGDFVTDNAGQVVAQQDPGQSNNFFAPGQPGGQTMHQQQQFGMPVPNPSVPPGHPGANGARFYEIQRVNGNGGNGKGDGVPGPHKHDLDESDAIKKNSVQRWVIQKEKEEKKVQKTYHKKASGNALATVRKHAKDNELKLFGSCFCPFVQRVWIALEYKGMQYQYVEVDPYKKPQALLEVNPRGLVPAIRHGDWSMGESTVLLDYLEDLGFGAPLLPPATNPQLRAKCRFWADHINRKIVPAFNKLLQEQDYAKQGEHQQKLQDHISAIVQDCDPHGPFFLGPQLSYVDIQMAPWVIRLSRVMKHYRSWPVPAPGSRWGLWLDAIENNEHVKNTTSADELYIDSYEQYSQNRPGTSDLADALSGGLDLP